MGTGRGALQAWDTARALGLLVAPSQGHSRSGRVALGHRALSAADLGTGRVCSGLREPSRGKGAPDGNCNALALRLLLLPAPREHEESGSGTPQMSWAANPRCSRCRGESPSAGPG